MISVEDQYFGLNRVLLLILGLWSYNNSKLARFQFICFFSILITFIMFQFTLFVTQKCTANFIIKVLSTALGFISMTIKYYSFCINIQTVKDLIQQLQLIYNDLKDSNEIAIIERYGRNAKCYTISVEYFVDQEKYFYYLLIHINAAVCIGFAAMILTGAMLIAYYQYICAMFTIASYRIENAMKIQISQNIISHNKNLIHKRIKSAVDIHRKAMEFCTNLISKFEILFLFLIIFGVMTLSLNIFRIFQIVSSTCNFAELSISLLMGLLLVSYMLLANLVGQEITDHYNYIYFAAYKIQWYIAPLDIQKLILILIQRGNKNFGLTFGKLFIASIQCFSTLANASLSYFTVMYSTYSSREMISIEDQYFSLNRVPLLILGLWSCNNSKLDRLQFICFFSILITFIMFQLITFITLKYTLNVVIEVLSVASVFMGCAIKYFSFRINSKTVRNLIQQLQYTYNDLKDSNEIAIIERYGRNAKCYTATLTILVVCSVFILISVQVWPDIQQIISSSNKSRSYHLQISVEYFVDQEKYFYYLLIHINAAVCIGFGATIMIGTVLIAYFQYMCAMFTIASYRIENVMNQTQIFQNIIPQNSNLIHKNIKSAVDIHRKAMEFSTYLISKFEISFFFLIIIGVMIISLNIFRFFQIISSTCNIEELALTFLTGFWSLFYMFLANLVGQEITDHCNYIYAAAYNIRWYIVSPDLQKLILILLQRSNKTFGLKIGRLFIASIQCFATLANASLSYFTVMYSVR
ncbi:uncharacterized protein [Anoplolepis gracilipes]|uniref:uncharacterized protein n=1 Tax=Anoplolepis gracilipes TaxID=354296 RepID=UPI003BA2AB4E